MIAVILLDARGFWNKIIGHHNPLEHEITMNLLVGARTAVFIIFVSMISTASDNSTPAYQKGTLAKHFSGVHKSYDLKDGDKGYQISNCADFRDGQAVDYRAKDNKVYIRRDGGKEYKCTIEATLSGSSEIPAPITLQKGTILGYDIRYRASNGGPGGIRRAKVYDLRGTDLIYEVDFCGSFQAGEFSAGQVVEFRVDGERVYIRHDNNKEYNCQLEGTLKFRDAGPVEGTQSSGASPGTADSAAPSRAKLSITSIPDGADIEVDGDFSGNTPSDLEVPEGEHAISIKKSGYKAWERTMKIVAGSSIHLNAEMEKTVNP